MADVSRRVAPRPIKPAMPTYADGYVGIRRHRGLIHRLLIWISRRPDRRAGRWSR